MKNARMVPGAWLSAVVLACLVWAGDAPAQTAASPTPAELVGEWRLLVTPVDRDGVDIRVEGEDGGPLDLVLTVRLAGGDRLACTLRNRPAECRITRGRFEAVMGSRSGGARMTFVIDRRTPSGFSGTASARVRVLPFISGSIGTVAMTRR
jgi:hypothetical protein